MTFPSFSPNEILTSSDMNAVGLWLVKSQTVGTGVTSVTVNDAFSANYEHYKVIYDGGVSNTATSLSIRVGAAVTGYMYASIYNQYNAATPLGVGATAATSFVEAGRASTVKNSLNVEIFSPFQAARTGFKNASIDYAGAGGFIVHTGGFLDNTTSYTSLVIFPQAGTITGGTIRVYGYRN